MAEREWVSAGSSSACAACCGALPRHSITAAVPQVLCNDCQDRLSVAGRLVVGTIITDDAGRIVLIRRGVWPGYGKWAEPGGYVDAGERPEVAAVREAREETQLEIDLHSIVGWARISGERLLVMYAGSIKSGALRPGAESIECALVEPQNIPWSDLAFPSTEAALRDFSAPTRRRSG